MNIIGIDPGLSGGIAWLNGGLPAAEAMPDTETDLTNLIQSIVGTEAQAFTAYVEDVPKHCGFGLPASRVAPLFRNYGFILGVLSALGVRTILVRPQVWQAHFGIGTKGKQSKTEWKRKLKAEAQRRFPRLRVTLSTADALLILAYGGAE